MLVALIVAPLTAVVGAAVLRPRGWATFALTGYVLLLGEIVAIIEALSLAHAVTPAAVLAAEAVVAAPVAAAALMNGLQLPPAPPLQVPAPLVVMAGVVGVAIAYELALAMYTPPNNWDSMTYHLSRAAAWYHHHRVGYIVAHSQRENESAPNAEMLVLFSFVFVHGDRLAAIWEWMAQLAAMASIYVIARRLGVSQAAGLFAALLFATMAQPALQASSTQNDLVAASLVACSVAFLCTSDHGRYPLAALALGLAIGTKLTVALALPAVGLIALKLVPREARRRLVILSVAAFAAVGAFGYVLNLLHTGRVQGSGTAVTMWSQHSWLGRAGTALAVPFLLIAQVDPTNQDTAYVGVLGAAAIVPAAAVALKRARSARTLTFAATLALAIPLFVVTLAYTYRFNPWIGRFMLVPVVLVAPLTALLYDRKRYAATVAALGVASLFLTVTLDKVKPAGLLGQRSIWTLTRPQAQALSRPAMLPVLVRLQSIPPHATIGYSLGEDDWDYPLYGADLGRKLVPLPLGSELREAGRERLRWLIVRHSRLRNQSHIGWAETSLGHSGLDLLQRIDH